MAASSAGQQRRRTVAASLEVCNCSELTRGANQLDSCFSSRALGGRCEVTGLKQVVAARRQRRRRVSTKGFDVDSTICTSLRRRQLPRSNREDHHRGAHFAAVFFDESGEPHLVAVVERFASSYSAKASRQELLRRAFEIRRELKLHGVSFDVRVEFDLVGRARVLVARVSGEAPGRPR